MGSIISKLQQIMQIKTSNQNSIENYQLSPTNSLIGQILSPEQYSLWYQSLKEQEAIHYNKPEEYNQWYYYQYYANYQQAQMNYGYSSQGYTEPNLYGHYRHYGQYQPYHTISSSVATNQEKIQEKKQKLSRNQKRKLKKKQLQQQYDKQKKEIGKWVDLQRKDLVQGLKKIQQQQQKIKQKRKQKLSHLIQIHKQVYKHMLKKNKGKMTNTQKIGNFRRKKKKPSHIKKMKELYEKIKRGQTKNLTNIIIKSPEQNNIKKQNQIMQLKQEIQEDQDNYVTQSESQQEKVQQNQQKCEKIEQKDEGIKQQQNQKKQKLENQPKQIKQITYKTVGKLNGYVYNGVTLRQWVDHVPSAKLQDAVLRLINRLSYKQAIKKVNQPEKARKIIIAGLHECRRTLWTKLDKKRSKLLIVALNIQRNNLQRGTDDQMQEVLTYAYQAKVPIVHISTRSKLGRAYTGKFGPRVTMLSIVNYQGYEDMMGIVMEEWSQMRKLYQETNSMAFRF